MMRRSYSGSFCPNCYSGPICSDSIEPQGVDTAYRPCWCDECGATWVEILTVTGFDNLEIKEESEISPN